MVAIRGLDHLRESLAVLAPVEAAAVNNNTANSRAVATNPLGRRVDNNVGTVLKRANKVASSAKGVVDDHGHTIVMGNLRNGFKIGDVVAGISDALNVNGLCLVVDELLKVFGLVTIDKLGVDAQARQCDLELIVSATVEVRGADDVVASVSKSSDGHELSSLARRGGNRGLTALKRGDSLLEGIDGRLCVHVSLQVADNYQQKSLRS